MLGEKGENVQITAPFYVDYGKFIYIGRDTEINMNCVFLDCNKIIIGHHCLIAPSVQIYTAFHPVDAKERFFERFNLGDFPFGAGNDRELLLDRRRKHHSAGH